MIRRSVVVMVLQIACWLFPVPGLCALAQSQSGFQAPASPSLVVAPVDDSRLVVLKGNTNPLARPQFDRGPVSGGTSIQRMVLVLRRSPAQEAALKQLVDQQQDKSSPSYHKWLTPQTFGAEFGLSDHDLSVVTGWLAAEGFSGIHVSTGRTRVEFSGTASLVQTAFHTSMHRYSVQGVEHLANASDPQIPAALEPVIAGIASLNDFARDAAGQASFTAHSNASRGPVYAITPTDLATIYNVLPLYNASAPIDGKGQVIAVVGQSDINPADFINFRTIFNLPLGNTSTAFGTEYLNIINNGPSPGTTSDEARADADTQWSGAIAKSAVIDYVESESTEVTEGSDLSATYIVDNNLAPVLVDSFSRCELSAGSSYNSFINSLWQQAAAQGITVVVAAGDNGSAGCDAPGAATAAGGLAVNAIASTPYNVAVGGTDFAALNTGAAAGYLPETAWNDNNPASPNAGATIVKGGSGGASSCTQSDGTNLSSCTAGYAKPSWQKGAGVPQDGVRDLPDVSLFAGDGLFGSSYFVCQQSVNRYQSPCTNTPGGYSSAGGTAFSSAAFGGLIALVNEQTAARQGNANYTLYSLAAQQGSASCAAGGPPAASCTFNDTTTYNNAMPCAAGSPNCGSNGFLTGYSSTAGFDLATGLGSVNAFNLVNNWKNAAYTASTTTLALSPTTIVHGQPVTANVSVTPNGATGQVSINAAAATGSVGAGTLAGGSFTATYTTFPGSGSTAYPVTANYGGDGTYAASESTPVYLTVTPEPSTTVISKVFDQTGANDIGATVQYGNQMTIRADVTGTSGQGFATGNVTFTDNGNLLQNGVYRLNSSGYAEIQTNALYAGTYNLLAAYGGDPSFNPSQSSPATVFTISKGATGASVASNAPTVSAGSTVTLSGTISTAGLSPGLGAYSPSGNVTFLSGATTIGTSTLNQGKANGLDASFATLTIPANQLPVGTDSITLKYGGDNDYLGSTSSPVSLTVTSSSLPTTKTALTVTPQSPQTVASNGTIEVSATVTAASGSSTVPGGTIEFTVDGQNAARATLSNGQATATLLAGNYRTSQHTVTAVYSGDSKNQSSVSNSENFTIVSPIGSAASNVTIAFNPSASVVQGTTVNIVATVTPASPAPTGHLYFYVDGTRKAAPLLSSSSGGTYTLALPTAQLQAGAHSVVVDYQGDANYAASKSTLQTLTIIPAGSNPATLALTVPASVVQKETLLVTANITTTSPPISGDLEVFLDNSTTPQLPATSVAANPQQIAVNTSGLTVGMHSLTARYSGDANHTPANSPSYNFNVLTSNTSFTLTPTSATVNIPIDQNSAPPIVFTVTPTNGSISAVNFTCSFGVLANVECKFAPPSITLNGSSAATTTLTVMTSYVVRNDGPGRGRTGRPDSSAWYGAAGGASFAGLLFFLLPRRRRRMGTLFALMAFALLGFASGCGSGISPAAGPYPITVTATSGDAVIGITTQTAIVNLTLGGKF